ncbi:MAG: hypothetical protein CVT79_07035 [Alphaproteobacteria bacterium HGW-Alphaproteobacteria-18]|nr:MAG: hypothetical protein CVT79_07035 [Alphaproteobacteria bacterium HGW-Alphaproteobacteria-18]
MRQSVLVLAAAALLSACTSAPNSGWTAREGAMPYESARAACSEISYNIEANFITCMAGRGWTKAKK